MDVRRDSIIIAPSEETMIELQEYSNVQYPLSFIRFLKEYNGAIPINNKFIVNGNEYIIERFLCVMDNPDEDPIGDYDISIVLTQLDERLTTNKDLIGDELIPIAALFAGNFLCLDFRVNRMNPSVCVWSHEESDMFEPVTYDVVGNFDAFIRLLER